MIMFKKISFSFFIAIFLTFFIGFVNVPVKFLMKQSYFDKPVNKPLNRTTKDDELVLDSLIEDIDSVVINYTINLENTEGVQLVVIDETNSIMKFDFDLLGTITITGLDSSVVYENWKIELRGGFMTLGQADLPPFQPLSEYEINNVRVHEVAPLMHEVEIKYSFETNIPYPEKVLVEVKDVTNSVLFSELHMNLNGVLKIDELNHQTLYSGWILSVKTFGVQEEFSVSTDVTIDDFTTQALRDNSSFLQFIFIIVLIGFFYFVFSISLLLVLAKFKIMKYGYNEAIIIE